MCGSLKGVVARVNRLAEAATGNLDRGFVLMVDDDEQNLRFLMRLVSKAGYETAMASTGSAALSAIQERHPDLVLLDGALPDLDGFEICAASKPTIGPVSSRLCSSPVSVRGATGFAVGIEVGADDFLTKPCDTEELTARVRSLLRLKRYTDVSRIGHFESRLDSRST